MDRLDKPLEDLISENKKSKSANNPTENLKANLINPLDRIDKPLDEIIKENKSKNKAQKTIIKQPKPAKSVSGKLKKHKQDKPVVIDAGRKPVENAPKYFDVDAPKVAPVSLNYGIDILPPPKKLKIFGKKPTE